MKLKINSKGITVDQYGREFNLNEDELKIRRNKFNKNVLHVSLKKSKARYIKLKEK